MGLSTIPFLLNIFERRKVKKTSLGVLKSVICENQNGELLTYLKLNFIVGRGNAEHFKEAVLLP